VKSLDEHNKDRRAEIARQVQSDLDALSGVACPKCGTEMKYLSEHSMNLSNPPSRTVSCPKCGAAGYKL